jgi:hypothetical protein
VIVILCHPGDEPAVWLSEALRDGGAEDVELVAVEQLVYSRRIVHRLGVREIGSVDLADGRVLRPEAIRGLVNRTQYLPTDHFARADPGDRDYATAELSAFLLAWLNSIAGRVLNPPLPLALGGGAFAPARVVHDAAMAGLPTRMWRDSTPHTADLAEPPPSATHAALVLDGEVFGSRLPEDIREACRRMASFAGVPLLQILLNQSSSDGGWRFVGASGHADFRLGGGALAAAVQRAFHGRAS